MEPFVKPFSGRGAGFGGNQVIPLAPRRAVKSAKDGVFLDQNAQAVNRAGRFLDQCDSDKHFRKRVADAAHFDFSLHAAACRIHATAVKLLGTRCAMGVGPLFCSFCAFLAQLPVVIAPKIEQPSQNAPRAIMDKGGDASEEDA